MFVKDPPVTLTDNVLMCGSNPYPLYLVQGDDEGVLFEAGVSAMGPLLKEQMDQLGIDGDYVTRIVVTHAHPDHVMALPMLRQMFPRAKVLASEVAARTLKVEKVIEVFCRLDGGLCGSLLEGGVITEAHRQAPLPEKEIVIDEIIAEGDKVAVGDFSFDVLQTPGHSDCSLSFFEPGAKILFPSDATGYYIPSDDTWWPNYFGDYAGYISSMERLSGLGAEVLCLSHNVAVTGADAVRDYFQRAIAVTKGYHARVVTEIRSGKTVRALAEELGSEIYAKTQLLPLQFFQKNCGVLVKQSLRHEGIEVEKK